VKMETAGIYTRAERGCKKGGNKRKDGTNKESWGGNKQKVCKGVQTQLDHGWGEKKGVDKKTLSQKKKDKQEEKKGGEGFLRHAARGRVKGGTKPYHHNQMSEKPKKNKKRRPCKRSGADKPKEPKSAKNRPAIAGGGRQDN